MVVFWVIVPLFLLPFIHYHPENVHRHDEHSDFHQHQGRYHSATLEAYAHLVGGYFSSHEQDDHFHHSHSSEEEGENDSEYFILVKSSKSFKEGLIFNQSSSRFESSGLQDYRPVTLEAVPLQTRLDRSLPPQRSPPGLFL